jgi:polysaccharide deacetylase family protein (PEP-CTERM system associated)
VENSNLSHLILTFDIEDWFTNGRSIKIDRWENYDLRVEQNVYQILSLLEEKKQKGTFFILGWVAEKLPQLIREVHNQGHEIASHGYSHELVYTQTQEIFREDVYKSKKILEDLVGAQVHGYRAPCFSITPWAIDILRKEGYMYDSSISLNSFNRFNQNIDIQNNSNENIFEIRKDFYEIMLPSYQIGSINIPWGGGGYFRLYPFKIYQSGLRKIKSKNTPFTFYLHPYEIDFDQPRVQGVGVIERIRRYYGLKYAYKKLSLLLENYKFVSAKEYYTQFINKI